MRIAVTGAGGFIGSHLCKRLELQGHLVRGIDKKAPEFSEPAKHFFFADLTNEEAAEKALQGAEVVYALAADMGGMGYLELADSELFPYNLRINLNTLKYAPRGARILFASSACIYPEHLQEGGPVSLAEADAYPAAPDTNYGWEKLTSERLYLSSPFDVRIARFHNVYGPAGTFNGGREKAPAAICRKVAEAKIAGRKSIEVWGDGHQVRSFLYIDDLLDGLEALMTSPYREPFNLGSDEGIAINTLVSIVAKVAGWPVEIEHVKGPQGVRSRNSDNTKSATLGWTPQVSLEDGLFQTYRWIESQLESQRS